jgi:DNA-binding XRE family transcriptional regulator
MTTNERAKVVRFHRKKSGLTQQELAKLAGVGKTVVFDLEKGKKSIQMPLSIPRRRSHYPLTGEKRNSPDHSSWITLLAKGSP